MAIPSKSRLDSTAYLRRIRVDNLEQYLKFIEPRRQTLYTDLRYLARYMVKVGHNVKLAEKWLKEGINPEGDPEIDLQRIVGLTNKYDLTWFPDCHKSEMDLENNKSLYHIAATFPQQFIDIASSLSPGTFDERRFWFCANNGDCWLEHCENHQGKNVLRTVCAHRLLSDVLQVLLTPGEPKLISVCSLSATIRHCDDVIRMGTFWANYKWIRKTIEQDEWGKSNGAQKTRLRIRYKIRQAEEKLQPFDVESFVDWWNMTSLRVK